ncbi:MAG: NAD(P)H-dependent oxidoreductase [Thermoplasmata archaeon]|nr:NAD(P)H-dependent oxidoreductase [Thermoplasmata archaeon]
MGDLFLPVIYGSVREGRVSFPVAEFVEAELAQRPGVETRLYDPRDLPLGNLVRRVHEMATPERAVAEFAAAMERADGFVLVTPEYNYGYPGTLKNLIDHLTHQWRRKPFALVGAGGISGGLRAIDGLRLVIPGVGGFTVPIAVPVQSVAAEFDSNGPKDPEKWRKRLTPLFHELEWYARALQGARSAGSAPP